MDAKEKQGRLLEAASAVLSAAPNRRLNITVLNKALFYLDLVSLLDRGRTITGNSYVALKNGPVIAKYDQRLILEGRTRGILAQVDGDYDSKPIVLLKAIEHPTWLDAEDRALATSLASVVGDFTSTGFSNLSHQNPGWQTAWNAGGGARPPQAIRSIDLRIALQQLVEDDEWLKTPLDQKDRRALDTEDAEGLEEW